MSSDPRLRKKRKAAVPNISAAQQAGQASPAAALAPPQSVDARNELKPLQSDNAGHRSVTMAASRQGRVPHHYQAEGEAQTLLKAEAEVKQEEDAIVKREPSSTPPASQPYSAEEASELKRQWKQAGKVRCSITLPDGEACRGYHPEALHDEKLAVAAQEIRHARDILQRHAPHLLADHARQKPKRAAAPSPSLGEDAARANITAGAGVATEHSSGSVSNQRKAKRKRSEPRSASASHEVARSGLQQDQDARPSYGPPDGQPWSLRQLLAYSSELITSEEGAMAWTRMLNRATEPSAGDRAEWELPQAR